MPDALRTAVTWAAGPELPEDAFWIGSSHPFDLHEAYLCFRSPAHWRLDRQPDGCELLITADSRYKLWINGHFVGRGPARCYPHSQSVDRLSVAGFLRPGANTLAVQVYQPGYSHFGYVHRAAAGLLCTLRCDGRPVLVSGGAWRVRRDPSFAALVPRVSIYASGVEERDLRLADDWIASDYDDSAWAGARLVAPATGYPWTGLRLRDLPLLVERDQPMALLETRVGRYPAPWIGDAHLALREGWYAAAPQPLAVDAEGWWQPALAADQAAYWLFDLGRDYAGQGWAEVSGACGLEALSFGYAEKIRDGELVISDPQTYCQVRLTDRFHLRPGGQIAEPFALRGGRYLLVQLKGPTGQAFRFRPRMRVSEYPLEVRTPLETGDGELDAIVAMCEATFHACLQDGFVDSTWRESSQWLGDALPQALIMAAMSDDHRPLRQVIAMAAEGAYPDGVLPGVLPGEVHAYTVVDYNFIWVELLALYWRLSRDAAFVVDMWPSLIAMMERFNQDLDPDGLLISQPGRRLFLDWAPVSREEPNAVYNLHYLLALQVAAGLAGERDARPESTLWRRRATALQPACRRAFWHQGRWWDDRQRTTFSQLAASLAILTETVRSDEVDAVLDAIVDRSLDLVDEHTPATMVLASPFMHHYLFEALRRHGRQAAVVKIIRDRWGRWARFGYPTTWENWNVDFPDGSQCHAFSAHPRYHLAEVLPVGGG